jgi:flagellar hook assembly protein FlgD
VVCNISGVTIRQVVAARASAPGANTVAWDGRSSSGSRVPAGRYLCKITARAADTGQQHSLVRSFQIAR